VRGPAGPLEALARDNPEWIAWLGIVGAALDRAEEPSWGEIRLVAASSRPADAPVLAGATLSMDGRALDAWASDVLRAAAGTAGLPGAPPRPAGKPEGLDRVAFMEAAIGQEMDRIDALAVGAAMPEEALRAVAVPLAMPVLRACARIAGPAAAPWAHGYCPLCGAWPALAEARGLEGSRQLRCARCGGDWRFDWLRCPFCGNGEHTALGGLVSEAAGEMRKVETCQVCRGYLKTVATLTARSHAEVVVEDAATVAYDVAAIEAGYARPAAAGYRLGVRVEARRRPGLLGRFR
jgi:FdhE protein